MEPDNSVTKGHIRTTIRQRFAVVITGFLLTIGSTVVFPPTDFVSVIVRLAPMFAGMVTWHLLFRYTRENLSTEWEKHSK